MILNEGNLQKNELISSRNRWRNRSNSQVDGSIKARLKLIVRKKYKRVTYLISHKKIRCSNWSKKTVEYSPF